MSSLTPSATTTNPSITKLHSTLHKTRHSNKLLVSCKSTPPQNDESSSHDHPSTPLLDRRNLLIGLGGSAAATAAVIGGTPASIAAPAIPDISKCYKTNNPAQPGSIDVECCLNFQGLTIPDFKFDDYPTVMKTRLAAHKVGFDYLKDFEAAVAAMRALDDTEDPRSLRMQALIHCAYCDGVYRHVGNSDVQYEVHNTWLFYALHRWELYFFERIAGKLIGKPDFALPFWAWDIPEGMTVPYIYVHCKDSPLYDETRSNRVNNGVVDLSFMDKLGGGGGGGDELTDEELKEENLMQMYMQMVGVRPKLFYGGRYVAGSGSVDGSEAGTIEKGPHNSIHAWVGGNVGKYWSAGKDPIFYGLHANVDRMWDVWSKKRTRPNRYTDDLDYKNASFVFYDENGKPVRVYAKDCFDPEKLGYKYEELPLTWMDYSPDDGGDDGGEQPGDGGGRGGRGRGRGRGRGGRGGRGGLGGRGPQAGRGGRGGGRGGGGGVKPFAMQTAPQFALSTVVQTEVQRTRKSRTEAEKEVEEEIIVVDVELSNTNDSMIKFDVYINDEYEHDPEERTLATPEYAGSFSMFPMHHGDNKTKAKLELGLNRLLQDLGAQGDDTLAVTLVPRSGQDAILVTGVKIDFLQD